MTERNDPRGDNAERARERLRQEARERAIVEMRARRAEAQEADRREAADVARRLAAAQAAEAEATAQEARRQAAIAARREELIAERRQARAAELARAAAARIAEERRLAEEAEAARLAEERRLADEAEAARLAAEAAARREAVLARRRREAEAAEAARLAAEAEAARLAEERRLADEAEAARLAAAEAARLAAEEAEAARLAEERRLAEEAEAARLAEERRQAEEAARLDAERRRIAEAHAEAARLEAERLAQREASLRRQAAAAARQRQEEELLQREAQAEEAARQEAEAREREAERLRLAAEAAAEADRQLAETPAPPAAARPRRPILRPQEPAPPEPDYAAIWSDLSTVPVDESRLDRNLIITAARRDPAHGAFDVLRTRMAQALAEKGWRRVAVTSPTKGCGKTFTALNLAITLSRYDESRTLLLDLDMRQPALAQTLGVASPGAIGDMLRGAVAPQEHLRRFGDNRLNIGRNLALGMNDRPETFAAELLRDSATARCLDLIDAEMAPDIVIFDLPPALAQDDVIALRPHFDCLLMVVGGGRTTAQEVRESLRRIGEDKPVLGMILNRADGASAAEYSY